MRKEKEEMGRKKLKERGGRDSERDQEKGKWMTPPEHHFLLFVCSQWHMLKQNVCLIFLIVFSKAINKEMKNKETSKRERVCVRESYFVYS